MAQKDGGIRPSEPKPWIPKRINLRGFFTELSKALVKVGGGIATVAVAIADPAKTDPGKVVGGWNTLASAFPDAIAALTNIQTLDESERAYVLVQRALSAAVAELTVEGRGHLTPKEVGEGVFDNAASQETEIVLAPDFLQRPREVALLQTARALLEKFLIAQGMDSNKARAAAERLPSYFGLSLHEELTRHADYYAPLTKSLKNESAPLAAEAWAWERYRAELIREPDRPLFDETFGLRQIFVPLRAEWGEREKNSFAERSETVVELEADLKDWLNSDDRRDALRVLSGDPGGGKSSCAKMWAAKQADERPGLRVVFVPLHRFKYKDDLQESLKAFLKSDARIDADLLDLHCPDNALLFFDGLDELAMQGKSAREAAVSFVRQVNDSLRHLNRDRRRIAVVLGGRQLVVQDCRDELKTPRQILRLEGYDAEERARWWRQFGRARGKDYTDLPEVLERHDLEELTAQPLLNYLLALSYERSLQPPKPGESRLDFTGDISTNAIYADLLDSIYQRVWGETNPHVGRLNQDEFEELLEEVGVAVWHGEDSRAATLDAIEARCAASGLTDALQKLEKETDAGVFRLLTAFHIRFQEGRDGSVEFTHKSFGEYLAARRIVRLMDDISDEVKRRKTTRGKGWDSVQALAEWAKLCGPKPLDATDRNLFDFLVREVRARDSAVRDAWRETFAALAEEMLTQGMPMEQCGLLTYPEMDSQARNAEESLLCALSACLTPETPVREKEPAPDAAPSLARWHFRNGVSMWTLAAGCVSALRHLGREFGYSNLMGANLTRANLTRANLTRANLTRANLTRANLAGANLAGANVTDAYLTYADLMGANLAGANVTDADLTYADLTDANLAGANLTRADLTRAYLTRADLRYALYWQSAIGINWSQIEPSRRPADFRKNAPAPATPRDPDALEPSEEEDYNEREPDHTGQEDAQITPFDGGRLE